MMANCCNLTSSQIPVMKNDHIFLVTRCLT